MDSKMATPPRRPQTAGNATDSQRNDLQALDSSEMASSPPLYDLTSFEASPEHSSFPISDAHSATADQEQEANTRDVLVALTYGLELAHHGAMLVEAEGRPQLANRAALAILQKQDGISLARTGLVADRASDTRLLHKLLCDAISSPGTGEPKDSPMILPRRSARNSLIVRVVPGPGLEGSAMEHRTALLKLYDQDMGLVVDQRALSTLYGLTRGEAALATRLVQGRSIEEAAAELFISTHTARTHLKRIFMKTDTHRQTELVVRMLLTVL